jgi:hypothetical protein
VDVLASTRRRGQPSAQPSGQPSGQPSLRLIDCDIHPSPRHPDDVIAHFSDRWREVARSRSHRFAGWDAQCNFWGVLRPREDAYPPREDPLTLIQRHVLDEYGVDYGVLNTVANAWDRAAPGLAADSARASNDWLATAFLCREPRLLASLIVPWEYPQLAA